MTTKLWGCFLLCVLSCCAHAQTVINTNFPNNNGNGSVTFEVQNTNGYDIVITGIQCHLGTSANNNIQLLYNTTPDIDNSPPWSYGIVGAGQNGWVSAGTATVNSNTANGIVTAMSQLSLVIPAGATYELGLSATTMQYSSLAAGGGVSTFSAGGVNLLAGDGISWGGTVYPSTPANYPRGLIGGITFVPALHIVVSAPPSTTAGVPVNFSVTVQDFTNATATGYTGTVHFTSSDPAAVLPADVTLTNGTGTFSATLKTAGSQTITATDTVSPSTTGSSGSITVAPGATSQFLVSAPGTATAGVPFNVDVTAADAFGNTVTGYAGTAHFTSSDAAAVLPANASLANGMGTFSATLKTAGNQTVTATDTVTASITGTSADIAVSAAAATHFTVSAPSTATAGVAFNFDVTALDAFGNTATDYAGTAHFTSTDAGATLPADATLSNGAGTFSATLQTAGNQTITATDTVTASVTGTSAAIAVAASSASVHFIVSAPGTATAGTALNVSVTAQDSFNNTLTSYAGTVHFTSTDAAAVLPANATLSNGTGTFSATLKTAGSQTITATDTVTASTTGTSGAIAVSAAAASHFVVGAPATTTTGTAFNISVTAFDAFNNTATNYAGSVHFSSTDPLAVLPANATLSNGAGTFGVTLKTAGSQSITVTDTVTATTSGTSNAVAVSAAPVAAQVLPAPMLDRWLALLLCALVGVIAQARLRRR